MVAFENFSGRIVIPWTSADTRTKNTNELDVVASSRTKPDSVRPKNESYELAVVTLSTHSGE
jgi:hypothetical protein